MELKKTVSSLHKTQVYVTLHSKQTKQTWFNCGLTRNWKAPSFVRQKYLLSIFFALYVTKSECRIKKTRDPVYLCTYNILTHATNVHYNVHKIFLSFMMMNLKKLN